MSTTKAAITTSQQSDPIAAFLELTRAIPAPRLTPDEAAAVAAAQATFDKWQNVRNEFSDHGLKKKRDEIRAKMRECPTKVAACVAELNSLEKNGEIACEEARWAQVRAVSHVRELIEAAYSREILAFTAFAEKVAALDLSPYGLSSEPIVARLDSILSNLRSGAEGASREKEPVVTMHFIRSPNQMASALLGGEAFVGSYRAA